MERKYTWNSVVVQKETLGVVERSKKRKNMWHLPAAEWCTVVEQSLKFSFGQKLNFKLWEGRESIKLSFCQKLQQRQG